MGFNVASHVRRKMLPSAVLYIYDLKRQTCERFAQEHAMYGAVEITNSAMDAVNQSEVVISIVPQSSDVRSLYLDGREPVIESTKGNRVILECSTIDIETSTVVGNRIQGAGIGTYVDSPISVSTNLPADCQLVDEGRRDWS